MSFLFPLGMAALGALAPLVVLYLLKQKRQDHIVPASFLWKDALEDLRASSLFQRLRTPLLFFLQAAAVVLCALAAAGASLDLDVGGEPRRLIVVVDRSRSMRAADEDGRTRMEVARELCADAADGLDGGDEMMLVAFDDDAEVLAAFTSDESVLEDAIARLAARDLGSRPGSALGLAASFAKASPGFRPEVIVLSDGAVQGDLPLLSCEVTFARIGTSDANQGIAEARLSRMPGERPQVFVRVDNGASVPAERTIVLRRGDEIVDARRLTLAPGRDAVAFFEMEDRGGEDPVVLDISLEKAPAGTDVLAEDDRVKLIMRPSVPRFGLLVRDSPNVYIDARKLESLHPGLAVVESTVADAVTSLAAGTTIDLIVYDGVAPATLPDVAAQIYIGCVPPGSGLTTTGEQEYPTVIDWEHTHPVTARCQFDDVLVEASLRLAGHERSEALVDTTGGPLVLLTPVPGREVLVIAMDPARSNLPLKLAWPLCLANSLDYLLTNTEREGEAAVAPTGDAIRVPDAAAFVVTGPGGRKGDAEPGADGRPVFDATYDTGVYTLTTDDGAVDLRAHALLDTDEIRIGPATELTLGGDRVEASPAHLERNVLLRDPLLLLALGILLLEWALWCGRR